MEQTETNQEELIRNCDAVIWISKEKEDKIYTIMSFHRSKNTNVEPHELGYKYNVMTFRTPEDVDTYTAIIGDPGGYVEGLGKAGYHGFMFKNNADVPSPDFAAHLLNLMKLWGFNLDESARLLQATVR